MQTVVMAALEDIPHIQGFVRQRIVEDRISHHRLSNELKQIYPNMRGLSAMSVRRFCRNNDIHATSRISDIQLDTAVRNCIVQVSDKL